jgi:signal transduction histidine kinase/CheY-like chemotaxis protein
MPARLFRKVYALPVIGAAAATLLLVTGIGAGIYNEQVYWMQKSRAVDAQARILAASVTAALAFDDRATAREYVEALRANAEVEAAGVYGQDGALVASYARGDARPPARAAGPLGAEVRGGRVRVQEPVAENHTRLGRVFLQTAPEPIGARLARHTGVALLLMMGSLLVAVLGRAQEVMRRANGELQRRAGELAQANERLREQMEEREKAEEALRQSQKMEAVGQLTGGVAHDFNNILMVASSGLDLLDRTADPGRRHKVMDAIRQAIDRGASLTRQLLSISRRTALQPQAIDLAARVDGMRVLLDRSLREDVRVDFDLPADLWLVEVDPSQLEVALLNIAVNARDAMPNGGRITISARNHPGMNDGELLGDYVEIAVADEGVGMSREVLGRIFEPFYTTKSVGKGTGLGLSQVYGFTKASGGDARVESAPGQGTTVRLFLPRTHMVAPIEHGPGQADAAPRGEGEQVLLVEDDEAVAALVEEMLRGLGYKVLHAPSAMAALSLLERTPKVELVFSDMVMPGRLNGMDLAREIARRRPDVPILLTTGFSEAAAAATREGISLLLKPYRIEDLAEAITRVKRRAA